jgi:hypothetical protein
MITQSFKVKDFENEETYEFHLISENNWLGKIGDKEVKLEQQDVEGHYDYFTSLWQDYGVTPL